MNIYEFAINMENDAEEFYTQQAELNKGNKLEVIFNMLAKDEKKHSEILQKKFKNLPFELDTDDTLITKENVFEGIKNFKNEIKETPDQLDIYRSALEMEQKSIDLYEDLLTKAANAEEKELFEFLIKQEQKHYSILEELVTLVSRPVEWVEDAEFGDRKEY